MRVSYLLAGCVCRLPSGLDIQLTLQGYCDALADCDMYDLGDVVKECVAGDPVKYEWAPDAATVRKLCADKAAARKAGTEKQLLPPAKDETMPTDKEYRRMAAKAARVSKKIGGRVPFDKWKSDRIADGSIKEADDAVGN